MDAISPLSLPLTTVLPQPTRASGHGKPAEGQSLDAIASNFESMFLSLLLKEMRQTLEPGGLFADDKADIRGGLFDFFLGQHLATAGGFGLAQALKQQLEKTAPHDSAATAPRFTN